MKLRSVVLVLCASLAAGLLLLPGSALASGAVRTISVVVAPGAPVAGRKVTFAGTVTSSPKGLPVKVQRKVGGKWATVRTTSTRSGGRFGVAIRLPGRAGTYRYRVFAPGFEGLRAATSGVQVVVARMRT